MTLCLRGESVFVLEVCSHHGIRFSVCRLWRMELHHGRRICGDATDIHRRLPDLLQAQRFTHRVRQVSARVFDHFRVRVSQEILAAFLCSRYIFMSGRELWPLDDGRTSMAAGYIPGRMVAHNMVTTQFELDGFRVTRTLGVVRGIVVRSRSIFGTIGAGLQTLVGGNITLLTNLCEKTRQEAFDLMLRHAAELGANAVVGARYDATEVMQGVTEVLAYGTAVFVESTK